MPWISRQRVLHTVGRNGAIAEERIASRRGRRIRHHCRDTVPPEGGSGGHRQTGGPRASVEGRRHDGARAGRRGDGGKLHDVLHVDHLLLTSDGHDRGHEWQTTWPIESVAIHLFGKICPTPDSLLPQAQKSPTSSRTASP